MLQYVLGLDIALLQMSVRFWLRFSFFWNKSSSFTWALYLLIYLILNTSGLHTLDARCQSLRRVAAWENISVGLTLTCHSFSNSPHISPSSCCELITNGNNNHKHITQIKDRLPKHFALPFIILKVRGPVRHKQILRRNKDYKTQRDVLLQINTTDRGEAKLLWVPRGIIKKKERERERKRFSHTDWSGVCCELLDFHLTQVNSIVK